MNFCCISKSMSNQTTILAFETSCDETGVAVVRKTGQEVEIVAQAVASQVDIHTVTGGVVPEVAAREHVAAMKPLIEQVMGEAGIEGASLDAVAVTVGPGLQPALAVGVTTAQALAFAWKKPVVPVHHLEGHIYSALLSEGKIIADDMFPALALIVSGGHTMLVKVPNHLTYEILGSTLDDAAGEAFDKVARLLGLGYPGGPVLSRIAQQGRADAFPFPRPMVGSHDLNFSFSGLKTAVLYAWKKLNQVEQEQQRADIAASFQQAVVETLVKKTEQALKAVQPKVLLLAGGVAANTQLQEQLAVMASKHHVPLQTAPKQLMGDNAAMIGQAAVYAAESGRKAVWEELDAVARLELTAFGPRQFPRLRR
jgi:N6-L-threonylcarbamoyladenine synthase